MYLTFSPERDGSASSVERLDFKQQNINVMGTFPTKTKNKDCLEIKNQLSKDTRLVCLYVGRTRVRLQNTYQTIESKC